MGVVLARIDQRLVHGIVVTQWYKYVKAKRIMVVDDEVSKDEAQKAIMRLSKPTGTGMSIISTETAVINFKNGKYDNHNVLLLVKEPSTLLKLIEKGITIPKIIVGIIFDREDREKITKNVALNDTEKEDLKELENLGIPVYFQFVPSDKEEPLSKFVK
ncbi:PTS system mannose/fructose/N-acetylgalactosamine-transporter subunit IIB [Aerococcus christensenii]|uniref:PTS system sorbose subfamily IIB component n=1 Tax=Aerococcus christensenii TaxID=87541 RepID=A0A133Y5P2_9LACT|nr:PTS sugar transporter subunit IIB [Aerococcus christensenii]KXB38524.1 PTS system sorbose subfamily IIB component [Aerococcus christensenii]MDK8234324.1 PTS sugar transporter subunit IIB [Aerococcus christensenii]